MGYKLNIYVPEESPSEDVCLTCDDVGYTTTESNDDPDNEGVNTEE